MRDQHEDKTGDERVLTADEIGKQDEDERHNEYI